MEWLTSFIAQNPEVASAVALVVFWFVDAVVTKTPNPLDNMIVRGLKWLWRKLYKDATK